MASSNPQAYIEKERCVKCRNIPWDPTQWTGDIDHHTSAAALENSAARGCYLCRSLRARIIYSNADQDTLPPGPYQLSFFQDTTLDIRFGSNVVGEDLQRRPAPLLPSPRCLLTPITIETTD